MLSVLQQYRTAIARSICFSPRYVKLRKVNATAFAKRLSNYQNGNVTVCQNKSTLDKEEEGGSRELLEDLKHQKKLRQDPNIWNKLFQDAKSSNENKGIQEILQFFVELPIHEVPLLYDLEIWKYLEGKNLLDYVQKLSEAGHKPPSGTLKKLGFENHSLEWLQPTQEDLLEASLVHVDVQLPSGIYKTLMPKLCAAGDVGKALAWHRKLVSQQDPPRAMVDVEQLRDMLLNARLWDAASEVRQDVQPEAMAGKQKKIYTASKLESKLEPEEIKRKRTLQAYVTQLEERVGIRQQFHSTMDDHTCAKFFATSFFSVEFVMDGLSLFGITQIGSLAMKEILKRTIRGQHCDSGLVRQYLTKMESLGLRSPTDVGKILRYLADRDRDLVLYDIATSEDDPDLLDALSYHENVLQTTSNPATMERTKAILAYFASAGRMAETRNILFRGGFDDVENMIADGVPIDRETRRMLIDSVYIDQSPWISETRLRTLIRIFLRLYHVSVDEWRNIIRMLCYIQRTHLRKDMEAMLLSLRDPKIFDFRTQSEIIRWYLRLAAAGPHEAKYQKHGIETMLGGVKILAALRDRGLVRDIEKACAVNLASLFGTTPLVQRIDLRKRAKAQRLGTIEDFITMIRELFDQNMWSSMPNDQIAKDIFAMVNARRARKLEYYGQGNFPSSHSDAYNPGRIYHTWRKIQD